MERAREGADTLSEYQTVRDPVKILNVYGYGYYRFQPDGAHDRLRPPSPGRRRSHDGGHRKADARTTCPPITKATPCTG